MNIRKAFAALRGTAGALLGAYLAARVFLALFWSPYPLEVPALLWGYFTLCPAAYLGYWCFRGLRSRRFGYGAAWTCTVLALPLAAGPGGGWMLLLGGLFTFMSCYVGSGAFLRYLDPVWHRDPRRVAARYGRGWLSHHWHISPPFGPKVPASFDVNATLHVQGDTVRVEPNLRKGWTFSVWDVAGVIQAPGVGHCVPYDAQGRALAAFCLSEKNGEMFAQYLRNRGVPFFRLSEVPQTGPLPTSREGLEKAPGTLGGIVWEALAEYAAELEEKENGEAVRHTDFSQYASRDFQDFRLELRRTIPLGALIGGGLVLGLAAFFAGFPAIVLTLRGGPGEGLALKLMLAAAIFFIFGPWAYALAKGELFPAYVSVENGHIWLDKGFRPIREIPPESLGWLRWTPADECYILFDKQGKDLLKFSTRDDSGPRFMNFLADHDIRLRSEP